MLKIITGTFEEDRIFDWLQGKLTASFDMCVEESWLEDDIIKEELRDVDHIVDINGLLLTKDDGDRIPIHWISQGSKQFIFATQVKSEKVVDCFHVGWNVYKYFYIWCKEKNEDITLLMNNSEVLSCDVDLQGLFLNTGEMFHTNKELVNLLYKNMYVTLSTYAPNNIVTASEFYFDEDEIEHFTGKKYLIDLKKGRKK